ncbi:Predicted hydrolase of the metallo-beta-lactamase superfamily [Thermofilum pendens Hrk 5]|uniref:UPF0282 protein Tpen_0428 n=1 Tax=Thermofilum pendens (strain DSM 2475 / Hrk 5) TaxID=368408 RepID=A1RXA7_THEPD|nr:Predicted hydrolase of the metallo-beta-lactamase superfamily [Thermofilum pendens Hrk 5]
MRLGVRPIADESLGVRSMSILVETPDVKILFDASSSLAPRRYGLPPHPEEFKAQLRVREEILKAASRADVVTVSHYHRDHYSPPYASLYECLRENEYEEIYSGKVVVAKHPEELINYSQRRRAEAFLEAVRGKAKEIHLLNQGVLRFGGTEIEAFTARHGESLGYVLCFVVRVDGSPFLAFLPDVQGPVDDEVVEKILAYAPEYVVVGGPPLYLSEQKVSGEAVEKGLRNLVRLFTLTQRGTRVIVSHHMLRDPEWRDALIQRGVHEDEIETYSSLLGLPFTGLEAYRKLLFSSNPPPSDYENLLEKFKGKRCDLLLESLGLQ